jgi:iron(III) transport system permease protein
VSSHDRVVAALAIAPLLITLGLVATVVWMSFQADPSRPGSRLTDAAYRQLAGSDTIRSVLLNTAVFTVVAVAVSGLFGVVAAWLVGRTNMPGKNLVRTLMTVSVILPGYLTAMGWLFLFGPRIGSVNDFLAKVPLLSGLEINIASPAGMGVVQGFSLAPLFFIMLVDVFASADPSFEEAAQVHGLRRLTVTTRVILPLVRPSVLAAAFYTSMVAAAAFDVPAIVGLSGRVLTLSTYLYLILNPGAASSPAYSEAAAVGVLLVLATLLPMLLYLRLLNRSYKYGVISGKGYRVRLSRLTGPGKVYAWTFLGFYFAFAQLLPVLNTVWTSLQPYMRPISRAAFSDISLDAYRTMPWDLLTQGFRNTVFLMLLAPTLAVFFAVFISWTVIRSRLAWRGLYDFGAFLPLAVPHVVFAMSMLLVTLLAVPQLRLYGTVTAILIVYVISHISFATRNLNGVLLSINTELDAVAAVHGIGPWRRLWTVVGPLLLPTMATTWLWLALLSYRELTVASFLATSQNTTLPAVIWSVWTSGGTALSAAASVLGLLVMIPLIVLYWTTSRRAFSRVEEGR